MRRRGRRGTPQAPMADDVKRETFRIGDLRRAEVRSYTARAREPVTPQTPSVGFPAVEALLESSTVEAVIEALRPRYQALEGLATKGTLREKGSAKTAMAAYERTADLLEYLFATKDAMTTPKP